MKIPLLKGFSVPLKEKLKTGLGVGMGVGRGKPREGLRNCLQNFQGQSIMENSCTIFKIHFLAS